MANADAADQDNRARNRIYPVESLTAETITAVADRVARATTFEDLIYRESEIDALWSLADIAARTAELDNASDKDRWAKLRERLWEAHDLVPEGRCTESAAVLRETITLI